VQQGGPCSIGISLRMALQFGHLGLSAGPPGQPSDDNWRNWSITCKDLISINLGLPFRALSQMLRSLVKRIRPSLRAYAIRLESEDGGGYATS